MSEFSHVFKMGKDLKTIQYVANLGDPDSLKHSSGDVFCTILMISSF